MKLRFNLSMFGPMIIDYYLQQTTFTWIYTIDNKPKRDKTIDIGEKNVLLLVKDNGYSYMDWLNNVSLSVRDYLSISCIYFRFSSPFAVYFVCSCYIHGLVEAIFLFSYLKVQKPKIFTRRCKSNICNIYFSQLLMEVILNNCDNLSL